MKKRRTIIKKIILESVMIIFSVLIALFINEWRNSYNEAVKTKLIIENIEVEIQNNQKFIQELIPYHESIRKKIMHAYKQDSLEQKFFSNVSFEIFEVAPNGIIQGKLNDIAWTVAKEEKITNRISINEVQALYTVYEQQKTVYETIDIIINFLSSREIQKKELIEESVIMFGKEIHELIGQEKFLNKKYSNALNEIKNIKNEN